MKVRSVREFLEEAKSESFDLDGFLEKVVRSCKKIQEEYSPFITIVEKPSKSKNRGKLPYLPISVKDNICTKGIQTTAGSKILEGYIPPFDATCVENVLREGGLIIGKTAMDEFGFGTFTTNCYYSIPKNPIDKRRVCGGSSGGAACLTLAADFPHIAIAQSTGGSIACPSSFTGTVGLTPTYGLVSRFGLIDYANSLDKIGCIGKEVYDVALLLSIIAGYDEKDSTSINKEKTDYTKFLEENVKGLKVAIPREYFEGVDQEISQRVWDGIKILERIGIEYEEVSLPLTRYALPSYYIIAMAEASTNLAKFCGLRYGLSLELKGNFNEYFSEVREVGFGEEAKRRVMLGTFVRMAGYRDAYYLKALKVRKLIINEFKKVFSKFDAIVAPTMPIVAPRFEDVEKLEPVEVYMMDVLTVPPELAGLPNISIPCGYVRNLPVGMHLIGDHFQEGKILKIAYNFEREWRK
ncbi:MAG: Asp-tRNA(Asn)/Glu-tRNA(Gln) amidotransferase subunit GatA [Candidatus Aenigmarchaeota archaeon]|nr:Asp-tRNA(Asn)/Glu-tRNA(Gln) amidotransferase subunit GatA [Candidatus Aenigmarchaeota archaeon]MCX8190954.1 Asp-tRNA(Asn)/Glu-tRNA(Gln) amidotransferase subunit GatA [Candidatus Aenigmarchaeota archaeon]MDW8160251.1 Asp-tRNA(Asn)/Glu-tRNA(Gln) amidotransferase subunit GatA [Candidatus Aenigmarchaeota archaeon]